MPSGRLGVSWMGTRQACGSLEGAGGRRRGGVDAGRVIAAAGRHPRLRNEPNGPRGESGGETRVQVRLFPCSHPIPWCLARTTPRHLKRMSRASLNGPTVNHEPGHLRGLGHSARFTLGRQLFHDGRLEGEKEKVGDQRLAPVARSVVMLVVVCTGRRTPARHSHRRQLEGHVRVPQ